MQRGLDKLLMETGSFPRCFEDDVERVGSNSLMSSQGNMNHDALQCEYSCPGIITCIGLLLLRVLADPV